MNETYKVIFHHENVPTIIRGAVEAVFMEMRNKASVVYNAHIGDVNDEWDKTGKPCAFGSYFEDINPEYEAFVQAGLQPFIDKDVNSTNPVFKIIVGKGGDLEMTVNGIKGSRTWISLERVR